MTNNKMYLHIQLNFNKPLLLAKPGLADNDQPLLSRRELADYGRSRVPIMVQIYLVYIMPPDMNCLMYDERSSQQ